MKVFDKLAALAVALIVMLGLFGGAAHAEDKLNVTSSAFAGGATIPAKFSGDGKDLSPELSWSKVPAQTKTIAVTCTDPDAPGGVWWHWIVFNLPASTVQLSEGQDKGATLASGAAQGTNDFGKTGYNGPAPPKGAVHHYHFTIFALDNKLNLKPGCSKAELTAALTGHILARGEHVGTYVRR